MTPEEMVSRLLYRDGLMLIIDKPAGLSVHKGPKGGPSLEDYFDALRFGLPRMPALAHRLDKETSGCLVLGRHRKALADLASCSGTARSARPTGRWSRAGRRTAEGRIDTAARQARRHPRLVDEARSERPAVVDHVEGDGARGRAHLARARAAHRAHAPVARALRRDGLADPGRQHLRQRAAHRRARLHLHAREIVVPLYKNRAPIKVTAPVPAQMQERLKACGWNGEDGQQTRSRTTSRDLMLSEAAKRPSEAWGRPRPSRRALGRS